MEVKEVDQKLVDTVMFKRIGVDIPTLPKSEGFESDQVPARALALSNRFGYTCFAHSRGFSVAKTADLLQVAEKLNAYPNGSETAQEASTATVIVNNIRSLALSSDELTVCACAGEDVIFYDLASLVRKSDTRPFEARKADMHHDTYAKDFCWSPSNSDAYLILTSQGKLLLGQIGSTPKCQAEKGVVAASWSADGQHIAYASDDRQLNITTSNFAKTFQHKLPAHISDDDTDSDLRVDAIRWVRPDSIVIGYVRVNPEGEEDEYPLFVLHSRDGNLAQEGCDLLGLVFYQMFPSIDPYVVPLDSGPYMLEDYVKPWDLLVAASRKSIDDHIVLMGWYPGDSGNVLYSLELENDKWIPRIELQESSVDNAILGLAIDRTTVQIELSDPTDESGDTMLPPCPVLVCLTLEGKMSFFSVVRLGEKSQVSDLVASPSNLPEAKQSVAQPSSQLTSKQDTTALAPCSPTEVNLEPLKEVLPSTEITSQARKHQNGEDTEEPHTQSGGGSHNTTPGDGFAGAARGSQGTSFQEGPASKPSVSLGSGSQVEGFQGCGAPVRSSLGYTSTAKVTCGHRGADTLKPSIRTMQDQRLESRTGRVTDMEVAFNAELEEIRKMDEKIDQLMSHIQGTCPGDAHTAPVAFTKQSLEELERDIKQLSEGCRAVRGHLKQNREAIEDLRDEEMRVEAWRIYTQGLMDQKKDSQYQELWDSQKLHPELELKQCCLLKADRELKQHIAELEGHLHILDLKQFWQGSTRRRTNKPAQSPGRFLSVQNLYNTVNSQMAVADELSNSLAKQIETLNIQWLPQSPKATASKILNSVRANTDDSQDGQSPLPRMQLSYSPLPKGRSMNNPLTYPVQDQETSSQEMTRRRGDSMKVAWVNRETHTTTIKRALRNKPSQIVFPNDSTISRLRQQQRTSSDFVTTEKWYSSQNAQPVQNPGTAPSVAAQSSPNPSFEGFSSSFTQWPLTQPEPQQTKTGSTFSSEDVEGSSSATHQGSAGQGIHIPKGSMFKWAYTPAVTKSTSEPSSKVLPIPTAKPFSQDSFHGSGNDAIANPRRVPTAREASFGFLDDTGGFKYGQAPSGKSTTAGTSDKPDGTLLASSNSGSKLEIGLDDKVYFLSAGENSFEDTGVCISQGNEALHDRPSSMPNSLQAGYCPFSLLRGSAPPSTAQLPRPPSTTIISGPASFHQISRPVTGEGASTEISVSVKTEQSTKIDSEPQKREQKSNLLNLKEEAPVVHFPRFSKVDSTKLLSEILNPPGKKRDSDLNMNEAVRKHLDSVDSCKLQEANQQGPPTLFCEVSSERPFDLSSSELESLPSTCTTCTSSRSSSTPVETAAPLQISESDSATSGTSTETGKVATDSPFTNLSSKMDQAELGATGKTGAATAIPLAILEQSSSFAANLHVATSLDNKGFSSLSCVDKDISIVGAQGTMATTSVFCAPPASTGLFSGSLSSSSNAAKLSPVPVDSANSTLSNVAPNLLSRSLFASASVPGFATSSELSVSAQFGQGSPFTQSAQQPMEQSFVFPGSSGSTLRANATLSLPSAESNEEDMEEEASTGPGTFGGFGGLGLGGSSTEVQTPKTDAFGGSNFGTSQSFQLTSPTGGQLFRPATFNLPAVQSSPQQAGGSIYGRGFGASGLSQNSSRTEQSKTFGSPPQLTGSGFGQPAQIGPRQQALGSALGAFGQTRQVGFGIPFGSSGMGSTSGVGFPNATPGGGFAGAATGGGFAGAATGGGFAGAATSTGFALTGGFGAAAGQGVGFGAFAGTQGASPGFGSGVPPPQASLFTQMRK